ncbi:hypothetical protein BH20ACT17_BH20ACT17_00070 [soil metagenome]
MRLETVRVALVAAAVLAAAGCGDSSSGDGKAARTATSATGGDLARDVRQAELATRATPRDGDALARLILLRFQAATAAGNRTAGSFSAAGKEQLRRAAADWARYLALDPRAPDLQLASLMVQAFGANALNDPRRAVGAQQIVVARSRPPQASLYAQLALLHYRAKQPDAGDRAAARAVRLSPLNQRGPLRQQLRELKSPPASQGP